MESYDELIKFTDEDWEEYLKNDKFFNIVIKDVVDKDIIERFKKDLIRDILQHALDKKRSKELYGKLIQLTCRYNSDTYCRFIDDHREDIYEELEYEDRFMLLKYLYTGAKDCVGIGYILQEEVIDGDDDIPKKEVENIKKAFNGKDKVTVYRGINKYNLKDGCSYTLDKSKAEWFANRYGDGGYVIEKEISVDDVIFYYNGRKEQEVYLKDWDYYKYRYGDY